MKKLITKQDLPQIVHMDMDLQRMVTQDLAALDENYGANRKITDMGGFVAVLENEEDVKTLRENFYLNINEDIPEYLDDLHRYIKKMFLVGAEYAIVVYIPKRGIV